MENTTKEKIPDAAVSFAENGYKGTNQHDLAAGMGLSKSALYKKNENYGPEDSVISPGAKARERCKMLIETERLLIAG